MIILKRLHVNNFKGLRDVDIIFPEQGNVLIEGHNEAGKSTLFEAVYVGLYGKPLVGEEERARQEDIIQYNQPKATVELDVSIGPQTLSITRIFERGRPQYAMLSIQQPMLQPERVSKVRAVDERILKELGNLDGESLRNSCFVEQKELGRIEALKRSDREQATSKLLGLERLTQLMEEFKFSREQERELGRAEKYLQLAQLQAQVSRIADQERTLMERLDAIKISAHLRSIADLAFQKETVEQQLRTLAAKIQQAEECLVRCDTLRAHITCADQIFHYLATQKRLLQRKAEAEAEQQRLANQWSELATKQMSLKQAYALVTKWETARGVLDETQQAIEQAKTRQREHIRLQEELHQREQIVHARTDAADQAEQERQMATEILRQATIYEELTAWVRLKGVELVLTDFTTRQSELMAHKQAADTLLVAARSSARTAMWVSIAISVLALAAVVAGFVWFPAFWLGILLIALAVVAASWIWFGRSKRQSQQRFRELNRWNAELLELDMRRQAAIQAGGDPVALQSHERQLQTAGMAIPSDLPAARQLLEDLKQTPDITDMHQARAREQVARENSIRLQEQQKQAVTLVEESQRAWALAQQEEDPGAQLKRLATQEAEQQKGLAEQEQQARQAVVQDSQWPVTSQALQNLLTICQSEMRSTTDAQQQHKTSATRLIQEAQADLAKAQGILLQKQESVVPQQASESTTQFGLAQAKDFAQTSVQAALLIENLIHTAQELEVKDLPLFMPLDLHNDNAIAYIDEWSVVLERTKSALQQTLNNLDEPRTKNTRDAALGERGRLQQQVMLLDKHTQDRHQQIGSLLTKRSRSVPTAFTREAVTDSWPLVAQVLPEEGNAIDEALAGTSRELYATRQQVDNLTAELRHPGTLLNVEECQLAVDKLREEREICVRAQKLLQETHERIARRVLPITEFNMQPLLQQLTDGRYRDVRLTPEDTDGQPGEMDYRIRVWNPTAGRYVAKNIFSGGTRDQCSLALRLAFALATLPQELGVAPGFIFLDEPLSAFDTQRAQALVELLTTGTIAQQFQQVVLISHYQAFEREAFRYHVRMEAGQIVESDLPSREGREMPV